jgi:ATP-dependent exoDNAse (exonuclease V) beta subunit
LSKFEGLGDKTRAGIAAIDKDTQAQVLFDAMSALTGNRNLAEAGSKFGQLAAARVGARGKEKRDLEKQANEYDFNIAKAREAAEKGDITLALQYQQLANQNKYQMGSLDVARQRNAIMGEAGNLGKVQLGLKNADAQALAEAKQRFPVVTKTNQAAFDAFLRKRANELKMQNPLTKQYANLDASDIGGMGFNVVQSLPKGASVVDI